MISIFADRIDIVLMKKVIFGIIILLLSQYGCFTGIENTGKISEKDVERVKADRQTAEEVFLDSIKPEKFIEWKPGKKFIVSDDNFRLILEPSDSYDASSLSLKGTVVSYIGYKYDTHFDNSEVVIISFSDAKNIYKYNTGKDIAELEKQRPEYVVPFVIDMDYIAEMGKKLVGQTFYIKTPFWYNSSHKKVNGVKFVAVDVVDVAAGDMVYPFHVYFKYKNAVYYVSMSSNVSSIKNTTFDKLFSFSDIRQDYKHITDENWKLITNGRVKLGMTKEECSLSLGKPNNIDRATTHGGLYERWSYDNGAYMIFENGILQKFRR